jgi:polysaccharide chain length determinant protein (PEP-CTERM system associated)
MEETHTHALDYLSAFRRRKWWLIVPVGLSFVVGAALVRFLPKEYRSSVTLGVDAPSVSPTLVNQTPTLDNQERMRQITQHLMSPQILALVGQEERLAADGSVETMVNQLRKKIDITVPEPVVLTNEPRRLDAFIVSYGDADPDRAQRVANRIARVFVDENSKARAARAEDTSAFIATQLQASQTRLIDLEGRLRRAKESHMGQLPEQTNANLQTLSGLRQQLEATATALRGEQDRLTVIERQLEGMKQGNPGMSLIPRAGATGGEAAATPESRVATLQHELATARTTYTDKHPEVTRLEEELAAARKVAAAERHKPTSDRLAELLTDPTYRQLQTDREIARLRVRDLERAESDARRQIGMYQARVESAPMVEQELATVQRDYELEKLQYSDLSTRLHSATIAENVERNRRGEQFTVLYAASHPTEPYKPIPMRVMLISLASGLFLGVALTLGREYFDRSVHDVRELKDEMALPVLGEVGRINAA